MKRLGNYLINSKFYISFAAVSLTIGTQIQLGGSPQIQPYLFIVFFATFVEYNLTRFVVLVLYKLPLAHSNDEWVNKQQKLFYTTFILAIIGLIIALLNAKQIVMLSIVRMTIITILYTLPFLKLKQLSLNLRKVPFLKIFLIMLVWSFSTVMLPILQLEQLINWKTTCLLMLERFLFIGALAILFDLRDVVADSQIGLKTIPSQIGESKSLLLSKVLLCFFLLDSFCYYLYTNLIYLFPAALISFLVLLYLVNSSKLKLSIHYHSLYLDGAILLHGLLIAFFYLYH
jgi:4-hydroxybenzoate polyprenyltransferase